MDQPGEAGAGQGEKRTAAKRKSAAHLKKSLEEAPSKEAKKRVDAVKEDYNVAKAASKPLANRTLNKRNSGNSLAES